LKEISVPVIGRRFKPVLILGGILFLIFALAILIAPSMSPLVSGKLHLPVGSGTPAISLGERHGLILASDGSLWSWGSDFVGWPVLGLGNTATKSTSLRRIGTETNWIGISAGMTHNLAIKKDGTLWTWGQSMEPKGVVLKIIPSPIPATPGNDWKQAAAGGVHSIALKKDGSLWGWGNNWAGSVGIPSMNGSSTPVRIGAATNWIKVWAGILETVGLQSDGTLWYWGENPDPAAAQGVGQILCPTRVGSETNWVDVGFGVNTVLAIKADGTLWAWGRQAHVYTGASNSTQNVIPTQVGTNSDWQALSATTGWWCLGLTRKDGSHWLLDASDGEPNGPRAPFKPVRFRHVEFEKEAVAYAGGAVHAAGAGIHGPIEVIVTREGEVWTWGMILGDPPTLKSRAQDVMTKIAGRFKSGLSPLDPPPVYRTKPWQLRNIDSD